MHLRLCTDCRGEYPTTSLEGGRCHACIRKRAVPLRPLEALRPTPPRRVLAVDGDDAVIP